MTEDTNDVEIIEGLSDLVDVDEEAGEPAVYEIGYHLLSTISKDALEKEVGALRDAISGLGGEVVGERLPVSVELAYSIDKEVSGKRESFTEAYFGWAAFELSASDIEKVKEVLDQNDSILRFLITKTSRDQVAAILADPSMDTGTPEPEVEVEEVVGADTDGETEAPAQEEEKA